jgi:hypothetical protein
MTTWLSGIIGQGIAGSLGSTAHMAQQNAAQQTTMAQQAAMNMSQGQMAATGPTGFGQGGFGQMYQPTRWMINGEAMTFENFINTIYPQDCAEKTMLILRLKKED